LQGGFNLRPISSRPAMCGEKEISLAADCEGFYFRSDVLVDVKRENEAGGLRAGADRDVQLIMETAQFPEMQACSLNAREAIERISQLKRIETCILELDLRPLGLKVTVPRKGVMHIAGMIPNGQDRQQIAAPAKGIPGIEQVHIGVSLLPS
jgi:hypothetical protein